jgi:hypothetical protein
MEHVSGTVHSTDTAGLNEHMFSDLGDVSVAAAVVLCNTDLSNSTANTVHFIRVTRIGELGTLAVTSNRTPLMEAICYSGTSVLIRATLRFRRTCYVHHVSGGYCTGAVAPEAPRPQRPFYSSGTVPLSHHELWNSVPFVWLPRVRTLSVLRCTEMGRMCGSSCWLQMSPAARLHLGGLQNQHKENLRWKTLSKNLRTLLEDLLSEIADCLCDLVVKVSGYRTMVSSGLLRRVALVRTDVSEKLSASFIRVTKISELGTTQAATSNRRTQRVGC